ncbi:type VI secretion protein IcmF/TssM N-terminal domain-containing protein [Sorangium sp. So ce291]|uniref:type VI secretion protein IcmF/TssM N-terminal domain-containing protein n=1 Tax=Sorangium sp. So ce291 TaxID=3133294 RepID=UPI003F5FB257
MKPLDDAQNTIQGLVGGLDPRALAAILVLTPVLAVAGVALQKRYKAQKEARKAAQALPPAASSGGAGDAGNASVHGAQVSPGQLRKAWLRFLGKQPTHYRRSILNFEHFVVFGAAASGKSTMADGYTDWRRQEKQFIASQTDDKDLPIYLTSSAVVMEIPAKVLHDHGAACRKALEHLWRPLYARRSPTVVVVVDASRLLSDPPDATEELAETIRGKINLLSAIRRRPLEVRVVLTHLDVMEGYAELASFCRAQGIAMRVPLPGKEDVGARLEAWVEDLRQHLPRALTALDADAYRRVVRFLRQVPSLLPPLRQLLASLFVHEALSFDPVRGGLFLASSPAGAPSPLRRASERGPGPDPRIRHLVAAALVASGVMTFLGIAFAHQYAKWEAADEALSHYKPAAGDVDLEERERETIVAFSEHPEAWLDRHPDFFESSRRRMRAAFSGVIRRDLLLPGLRHVAKHGKVTRDQIALPSQRSLYYLALIHGDRHDALGIQRRQDDAGRNRLHLWASMTGLDPEVIVDYLENTDEPVLEPVTFDIDNVPPDRFDTEAPWWQFVLALEEAMRDGVVEPAELERLQQDAASLEGHLDRLRNADVTLGILDGINKDDPGDGAEADAGGAKAAGAGRGSARGTGLARAYEPQFGAFLQAYSAFRSLDVDELAGVLEAVRGAGLDVDAERGLLLGLVSRLEGLYTQASSDAEPRLIALRSGARIFDESAWVAVMRDSRATLLIQGFVRTGDQRSIFFGATGDDPQPVAWNPASGAETIFTGRSLIDGRFTRAAYDARVRGPVLRLRELLRKLEAGEQAGEARKSGAQGVDGRRRDRAEVVAFVKRQVERYADAYRDQSARFVEGFQLSAPSTEALRIALALMSDKAGGTTFDDFLKIVDENVTVDAQDPDTKADEPMLAPMVGVSAAFARWHEVVDGAGAAPRVVQYKAILEQMLKDLAAKEEPSEGGAKAASTGGGEAAATGGGEGKTSEASATSETLEQALAPSGRLVLAGLRSDKGAYASLIRGWIKGVGLPERQQKPFLAPLSPLSSIGRSDIQGVVSRVFQRDFMPDLERVVARFPFDPAASEEVTPEELTGLFHPKDGRIYDLFRRYLEPLSQVEGSGGFRMRPSVQASLALPDAMYRIVNAAGVLSARLWDEKGKPKPLRYRLTTVPLGSTSRDRSALTLVYFNVGPGSLFNFNQKPATTTLELDWAASSSSQVGAQLTDVASKEDTLPPPVVADGSNFSFLRLLRKATQPPAAVKEPAAGQLYTWQIPVDVGAPVRAQLVVLDDPWETFSLARMVNAARSR